MERAALAGELTRGTGGVEFALAEPEDDPGIRRLLRDNPMGGPISISNEREPNFFASCGIGSARERTIVARSNGQVVCMGSCSYRKRFVNGRAVETGYLGGLRLDQSVAGRFDILRRGYQYFEKLGREEDVDCYFTAVAAENRRAIRFLGRGLSGMPRYEFLGEFVTLLISTRGVHATSQRVEHERVTEEVLNHEQSDYHLAAAWKEGELDGLRGMGLDAARFLVSREQGDVVSAGAVWNQTAFKQTVVRGYSKAVGLARPFINLTARLTGSVTLPPCGSPLKMAFLSPIFSPDNCDKHLVNVVRAGCRMARESGGDLLALGFDARDPRLASLRRQFRPREYRSRLYSVIWKHGGAPQFDGRLFMPEAALL